MKVIIFIGDGVIGHVTLNKIIPDMLAIGIEPVILRTKPPALKKANIPELKSISFLESGILSECVEPLLDNFQTNDSQPNNLTLSALAKKYQLHIETVEDVNRYDFLSSVLKDKEIKGAISIRSYPIFKPETIRVFKEKGFMWNLHTGLLPKYRGVFIPYHAIANKEKTYGWTLHEIASGIDLGAIIATDSIQLDKSKPILETYLSMSDKGASMVVGALMFFQKRGNIPSVKQTEMLDSYFTFPTAQKIKDLKNKGIRFANDIAETYARLFTIRGSLEENILINKIKGELRTSKTIIQNEFYEPLDHQAA
ncbi:MAG TPA: formyltransferase family protein [Alphaproteobacteria bacterium]|nr:formyltransferase family protein [Alphaproteobacteria bacterium]